MKNKGLALLFALSLMTAGSAVAYAAPSPAETVPAAVVQPAEGSANSRQSRADSDQKDWGGYCREGSWKEGRSGHCW